MSEGQLRSDSITRNCLTEYNQMCRGSFKNNVNYTLIAYY